jgi:hypothetical protein
MITVKVIDVKPHPDQATNNPGCWAVQLRISREGHKPRTFWRWHTVRENDGRGIRLSSNKQPTPGEIVTRFWDDTFAELHGFNFEMAEDTP